MSALEELMQAALAAPEARRAEALRVLRGEARQAVETDRRPEPYLTLRVVAKRLGISPCSLWRWQVPGHELGGRRRFRLSEVQAYLESDAFERRAQDLREARREVEAEGGPSTGLRPSGRHRTVRTDRTNGTNRGATEE